MKMNHAVRKKPWRRLIIYVFLTLQFPFFHSRGQDLELNGPMLGFIEQTEAGIWVQTDAEADLKIVFALNSADLPDGQRSMSIVTKEDNHFIAHFILKDLEPGEEYSYFFEIEGQRSNQYEFQTRPKAESDDPEALSIAFGSCADFDPPLSEDEKEATIFEAIAEQDPDLMIWLGDNLYLKEEDFESRENMFKRYDHVRSRPYMKELMQNTHHYAIWDDHDFGPNNSNSSYKFKDLSLEAFQEYWIHKNYVFPDSAITHSFSIEDADFFMMDNRSFRIVDEENPETNQIWGQSQLEWLKGSLKKSQATFKIICTGGQLLSDAAIYENHANDAPDERQDFLDFISSTKIGGVLFLTGDRHSTEITAIPIDQERTLFDWTVSPFRAKTYDHSDEPNSYRIPGSMFAEHMFGIIKLTGEKGKRKLELRGYNKKGTMIWAYDITEEMLY